MKYIIKNCPNFIAEYMFFGPCKCEKSGRINGVYQDYCKDINDCPLKRIVGLCEEKIKVCEGCSKTADINIDCVECDEKGEANTSRAIVNLLEIEEVDE